MAGLKKTLCTSCIHREVCKHKTQYLAVLDKINDLSVTAEEQSNENGARYLTCPISQLEFFVEASLPCRFFLQNNYPVNRDGSVSSTTVLFNGGFNGNATY